MVVETEHSAAGTLRMLGSPLHLAESAFTVRRRPPLLGEHTAEVLAQVGLNNPARPAPGASTPPAPGPIPDAGSEPIEGPEPEPESESDR